MIEQYDITLIIRFGIYRHSAPGGLVIPPDDSGATQ
jgi:hypothetical protein